MMPSVAPPTKRTLGDAPEIQRWCHLPSVVSTQLSEVPCGPPRGRHCSSTAQPSASLVIELSAMSRPVVSATIHSPTQ